MRQTVRIAVVATGLCALGLATVPISADDAPAEQQTDRLAGDSRDEAAIKLSDVAWAGYGTCRILLEVDPVPLDSRREDEGPAQVEIDWVSLLQSIGASGKADLRTVQVMQVNPDSGRPVIHTDYAYQRSPYDRAFCWYDDAIPYEFPEVFAASGHTDGDRKRTVNTRAGYMYNAIGDWKSGKLVWSHTQVGNDPTYYAAYFDRMDADTLPPEHEPTGWIGDGMPRHARQGDDTTGADSTHIALDDWNDDGLVDLVYGEQYGQLFVMLNEGTPQRAEFGPSRMIVEADGSPLDVGIHAAPLATDWDQDGAKDLLVGTYQNRVAYFRNTGTNRDRKYEYAGLLRDPSGEFFSIPVTPVAKKPEGVFKKDYFPVMSSVDWDNDGDLDLLCGGYITGRVYFYRNIGQQDDGPILEFVGPLEADGGPINVRDWCAAPCVADFNGDGLLDLIVGSYTWHDDEIERPSFLRYYVNVGSADQPLLEEKPLPVQGRVTKLRLPHPRASDLNGDGLLDLVVSSGSSVVLYPNVGTSSEPKFDIDQQPLRAAWGNASSKIDHQLLDWNDDGWPDLVNGYTVYLNSRIGKPYFWEKSVSVLPDGMRIDHPAKLGDGHFYPYLDDFDGDGKIDVLFGDWFGHVWFHRNLSTADANRFDMEGQRLETADGRAIKVGPVDGDTDSDFQALQGARTTLIAGDYNDDGLDDLIVGDTFGIIRYYENLGPPEAPRFADAVTVADLKSRLHVDKADWNCDGRLDVVASLSAHKIYVFLNKGTAGEVDFGDGIQLNLTIKNPIAMVADLNRDGDDDLVVNGGQGTAFVERSFIEHGYARARIVGVDSNEADVNK